MPLPPSITQEDKDRIDSKRTQNQTEIDQSAETIARNDQTIADSQAEDSTIAKMSNYYISIIDTYELERKALDGQYISAPVTETDIINCGNNSGRLYDASQNQDVLRIAEFDGGPLVQHPDHEKLRLESYDPLITRLTNGLLTNIVTLNTTVDPIGPGSIGDSFEIEMDAITGLSAGIEVVIYGSGQACIATVTSVDTGGYCSLPMYTNEADCLLNLGLWTETYKTTFTLVTPLSGTIAGGGEVQGQFTGFNDSERSSKTASFGAYQPLMDYFVFQIDENITAQLGFLNTELTQNNANPDPSKDTGNATIISTKISEYQAYQSTLDLSDTGISYFSGLNSTRLGQLNSRISSINSAKSSYYENRYKWAVDRGGRSGPIARIKATQDSTNKVVAENARKTDQNNLYTSEGF